MAMCSRSKRDLLLIIQLSLLLVQVLLPLLYYNATILDTMTLTTTNSAVNDALDLGQWEGARKSVGTTEAAATTRTRTMIRTATSAIADANVVVGTFNGVDVSYVKPSLMEGGSPLHSTAHCIGETFHDKSWVHRSCLYTNMCFDIEEKEFVVFRSPAEHSLQRALDTHNKWKSSILAVSSSLNTTVALGGINPKWGWKPGEADAMKWAPKVIDHELTEGYYQFVGNKVFVPFHSMAAVNVGHLIWDDFLPIYTLLSIFQLLDNNDNDLMLVRYVLKNRERALWATCDLRDATKDLCNIFFKKFLPLLGVLPSTMRTTNDSIINITTVSPPPRSRYICSPKAAAGIRMLTDHGLKTHGWSKEDYEESHNVGRGPMMLEFRNFMMRNLGLDPTPSVRTNPPYKIIFAVANSKDSDRRLDFKPQISALREASFTHQHDGGHGGDAIVDIELVDFPTLSIEDQVRIASEASILIGVCGGGAVTHMFLPEGSGLILFYTDNPTGKAHNYPARLDWDYFNNAGYLRVHWLPTTSMYTTTDLDVFVKLVQNELETISHH